jgi:hypothetical protein
MPKKISVSTLLLIVSAGPAMQTLIAQQSAMPAKTPQGRQSSPPSPKTNATSATVSPLAGDDKAPHNQFTVTKKTNQVSPEFGPAAAKGKVTHAAISESPPVVAGKKTESASAQTVSIGASRAEGAGSQITKLGAPRTESATDQTNQVGVSRHHAKTAAITPPASAVQAGSDGSKKKKFAVPPHWP